MTLTAVLLFLRTNWKYIVGLIAFIMMLSWLNIVQSHSTRYLKSVRMVRFGGSLIDRPAVTSSG